MRTDRRGFLGLLAGALGGLARPARAQHGPAANGLEIHRITRNTRAGAIGRWLSSRGEAPPPAKEYAEAARVELPEIAPGDSRSLAATLRGCAPADTFEAREIAFATFARLLHLTNGVTGEFPGGAPLRAAPSAGALYAGEVYAAAERVRGLAPGLYHFAVLERALVRLREGPVLSEVARALEEPGRIGGAAFAVLLTNVFARYGVRYANRGYRYALIDTGHIAENLRLAAASEGLGEAGFTRFHDGQLDSLLGLDGRAEAVCFVAAVGAAAGPAPRGAAPTRDLVESDPDAGLAPGRSVLRYHEATRLVWSTGAPRTAAETLRRAAPGASGAAEPPAGLAGEPLPRRADPPLSVDAAIRARRSPLVFGPEAIDAADLGFVLAMARADARLERAAGVELFATAHRVRGVAPGLYASDGRRLWLRRAGDLREALVETCLGQEKAGRAAAAIFMVARPAEVAAQVGARSYRDLLVECGAIGERIYLAAESIGLAARNLAAFRDDELAELLGFGPDGRAVLHLTLVGHDAAQAIGTRGRPRYSRSSGRGASVRPVR